MKKKELLARFILDACCGSRMFWDDKQDPRAVFMDNRVVDTTLCDGRRLVVAPDVIGDFRDMPFEDESFSLVVFDPPHLLRAGEKSWLRKKYGILDSGTWRSDVKNGFSECMRVLRPLGTLIVKWNCEQIPAKDFLDAIGSRPLFGQYTGTHGKTLWMVFAKASAEVVV